MKKLSIDILSNGYPVMDQDEMLQVKGGVSEEEFLRMLDNGTWTGGQVDGWGYVAPEVVVYGKRHYEFGYGCPKCTNLPTLEKQKEYPIMGILWMGSCIIAHELNHNK
jgi:hypothetical protein